MIVFFHWNSGKAFGEDPFVMIFDTCPHECSAYDGCIRIDRELEGGRIRTDFYLVLKDSFHHVTMEYPAAERERYAAFADRMMASMGAGGNDLG